MITSAIYHRPESEFAYLREKGIMQVRIRTARGDIDQVQLIHGDPYLIDEEKWYLKSTLMKKYLSTELYDFWLLELTAKYSRMSYAFKVTANDGLKIIYGERGIFPVTEKNLALTNNYFKMPYFQEIDRFKAPDWVKKTIWYQIFPERFANGDSSNDPEGVLVWGEKDPDREDFFGGDLQGVIDHLDYLIELGINGLYFCPIFEAASNHKYDTIDYWRVDQHFGSNELFKELVKECHKRDIKVMLDAVFNHIGDQSPQWQDVMEKGPDSSYADWFHVKDFPVSYTEGADFEKAADLSYDVFAFTPHMPKLNTANPEVQKYLLDIAKYWITEYDIDAWRLDVANEVDHHFWRKFREACDSVKTDFYILGEIWHSSQAWLQGDQFHAVMNYTYTDAIMAHFVKKQSSSKKMISEINQQLMLYRDQTNQVQFNVLDSHDTPRLLTEANHDVDLFKQTTAFTYLQPGTPCIYYGDEIGLDGDMDPDCRKCMIWEPEKQNRELYQFYQRLITLRKNHQKVISEGEMQWEQAAEAGLVKLIRSYRGKTLVGIFNSSEATVAEKFEGKVEYANLIEEKEQQLVIAPKGFAFISS